MKLSRTCIALATTATSLFGICTSAIAYVPFNRSVDLEIHIASSSSANCLSPLVDEAWQVVEENYTDPTFNGLDWRQVREEILSRCYTSSEDAYAAIQAMLSQLNNPATRLLTPQQFAGFEREDSGQPHIGVGLPELLSLDIDEQTRQLTIVTPAPNTPAADAGLLPGDQVVGIDGVSTSGMDLGEAAMRLRGSEGSTVRLAIQRGNSTFDVVLTRKNLTPVADVQATLQTIWGGRKVGYMSLHQFTESSPQQVRERLKRLQSADGFVLDLRNNPGGSVVALQEIAGLFLGETVIGRLAQRTGTSELRSTGTQVTDKPLVVLVNQGTASAAELLAGALQDSQRAVVVGMPTFGKGLVHNFLPLADGAVVAVTIGQLQTPKGQAILNAGIIPNVRVDLASSPLLNPIVAVTSWSDTQYRQAIEQLIMQTEQSSPVVGLAKSPEPFE